MATNANPAPTETVKSSPKLKTCISALISNEAEKALLYDNYKATAKTEAVRLGITDRGTLTALLKLSGDSDNRRMSIVAAYVFPTFAGNRAVLDKATETNKAEKNPNKRISQDVMREIASSKVALTVPEAKKLVEKKKAEKGERAPGGKTDQTDKASDKAKKKNPDKHLTALLVEALTFAKENEYDMADFQSILEIANAEVELPEQDSDDDDEDESDD